MENIKFCQSCGMPMGDTDELYGTNADGTKSVDYCHYCFKDGKFGKEDETMEEMIETCIPFIVKDNPNITEEQARAQMMEFFPKLKRWAIA